MRSLRRWWARRPLRSRITLTVGVVALVALLALSRLATAVVYVGLVDAADQELRSRAGHDAIRMAPFWVSGQEAQPSAPWRANQAAATRWC